MGGLLVASVISVGVWFSPAFATLKGMDIGDLDSDAIGKATNAEIQKMKRLEESKKTPEDKAFEQEMNAVKDRMRVVKLGRRMNPDLWGPKELDLFKDSERMRKRMATMFSVGGGLVSVGLAIMGRTAFYEAKTAPLFAIGLGMLILSAPMWIIGKKAARKRGRDIKAIYNSEQQKMYEKIVKDKMLRMSRDMPNDDGEDYQSERGMSDTEVEPRSPVAEDGKN